MLSEGQMLLHHNSQVCSGSESYSVGERIYRMVHVEKDLGYNGNVDDGFKEPKDCRKQATALNNRCGANGVSRDITDSRNNN